MQQLVQMLSLRQKQQRYKEVALLRIIVVLSVDLDGWATRLNIPICSSITSRLRPRNVHSFTEEKKRLVWLTFQEPHPKKCKQRGKCHWGTGVGCPKVKLSNHGALWRNELAGCRPRALTTPGRGTVARPGRLGFGGALMERLRSLLRRFCGRGAPIAMAHNLGPLKHTSNCPHIDIYGLSFPHVLWLAGTASATGYCSFLRAIAHTISHCWPQPPSRPQYCWQSGGSPPTANYGSRVRCECPL